MRVIWWGVIGLIPVIAGAWLAEPARMHPMPSFCSCTPGLAYPPPGQPGFLSRRRH